MVALDVVMPRGWDTAAGALAACARALGDGRDAGAMAVASGLAFRLLVDERLTPAGPHAYAWREELTVAAERLGCRWRLTASQEGEPLYDELRAEAAARAVEAVRAGRPTLLFGVQQVGEFGLVRGCSSDGATLLVSGVLDGSGAPAELPVARIGEVGGILFALELVARVDVDAALAARAALRAGAGHLHHAALAWRRWSAALASGDLDPTGLAIASQRHAEARALVATHLGSLAAAAGLELPDDATRAARRSATMLAELARLFPFPPGSAAMLTSTLREEAGELVADAARADAAVASALTTALAAEERRAAARELAVRDLDGATLPDLFVCVDEIPIEGLRDEAAACREALAPTLGTAGGARGKLLYRGGRLVGHLVYAELDAAAQPVAASGRRWFAFCPWLARELRGQGLGALLFDALRDEARREGVDGVLAFATSIDVWLHHHGWERHGFVEVARRGDTRLVELALTDVPSCARFVEPGAVESAAASASATRTPLGVTVRHRYTCPLLLRVERDVVRIARRHGERVHVDEADARPGEPAGVTIGGKPLVHGPLPVAAIEAGMAEELARRGGAR